MTKKISIILATLFLHLSIFNYAFANNGRAAAGVLGLIFFSGFFFIWIFFMIIFLLGFAFWLFMLVDCIRRDFPHENDKLLWILILVFVHWIGAIIYYFLVKRKKISSSSASKDKEK